MLTHKGPVGVDGEVPGSSEENLGEKPVEAIDVKPHPHIHLRLRQGQGGRAPRHLALLIPGAKGVSVAPSGCFFFFFVVVSVLHSSTTSVGGAFSIFLPLRRRRLLRLPLLLEVWWAVCLVFRSAEDCSFNFLFCFLS